MGVPCSPVLWSRYVPRKKCRVWLSGSLISFVAFWAFLCNYNSNGFIPGILARNTTSNKPLLWATRLELTDLCRRKSWRRWDSTWRHWPAVPQVQRCDEGRWPDDLLGQRPGYPQHLQTTRPTVTSSVAFSSTSIAYSLIWPVDCRWSVCQSAGYNRW